MSKKQKIYFNIIMIVAIVLLTIATVPKTLQEDTYYMIKVGEYIFENGMDVISNKIEPFSWIEGMSYSYPHWFLDIVFYLVYNMFNFAGIYVFTVIAGIIIYLLIYYTNIKVRQKLYYFSYYNFNKYIFLKWVHNRKSANCNIFLLDFRSFIY